MIFKYLLLTYKLLHGKFINIFIFYFQLRFTPCKAEQPLQGMELQEKKHKKIRAYRKSV